MIWFMAFTKATAATPNQTMNTGNSLGNVVSWGGFGLEHACHFPSIRLCSWVINCYGIGKFPLLLVDNGLIRGIDHTLLINRLMFKMNSEATTKYLL